MNARIVPNNQKGDLKPKNRAEIALTKLLDAHNIRWQYEPHRMELSGGTVITPDLLLPDFGIYLEVTMRGGNSKIKRARHLYEKRRRIYKAHQELEVTIILLHGGNWRKRTELSLITRLINPTRTRATQLYAEYHSQT